MKIENISDGKVIGIGGVTVLPGKSADIPDVYERSPILAVYERLGIARIKGKPSCRQKTPEELEEEQEAARKKAAMEAELAKEQALAIVNAMKPAELTLAEQAELFRLSSQYGVNPADCKDQADIVKKLKTVLKKQ